MRQLKLSLRMMFLPTLYVFLLFPLIGANCTEKLLLGPGQVVAEYCRRELAGVRLSGSTWEHMAPLVIWKHEPTTEPIVIVSAFRLKSVSQRGDKAVATVEFDVLGQLDTPEHLTLKRKSEVAQFQLLRRRGKWKIFDPDFPPHVTPAPLRKHIQGLIEADERAGLIDRKDTLSKVIRQLDALLK